MTSLYRRLRYTHRIVRSPHERRAIRMREDGAVSVTNYAPLVGLKIEHEFFVDARCDAISCQPDAATVKLLRDCGLVLKTYSDGVSVSLDQNSTEALAAAIADTAAPPVLWFRLHPTDKQLSNCTIPSTPRDGEVLMLSGANASDSANKKPQSLAKGATVSVTDFIPFEVLNKKGELIVNPEIADVLTSRDRRIPPLAFVCITLSDLTPRGFVVRFEARQTYWKYYVLGDLAKSSAKIVDTKKEVEFELGRETTLADERRSITFISKVQIPLRERSNRRFQLRDNGSGVDKVLIKNLPVASKGKLYKDTINGQKALVSDIYVNC